MQRQLAWIYLSRCVLLSLAGLLLLPGGFGAVGSALGVEPAEPATAAAAPEPRPQAKRPMTIDDALNMVRVGNVAISPDGDKAFYSERHLNWDKNDYETRFFMVPSAGGAPVRFINERGGRNFQFSPDGVYLSMLRRAGGDSQIFLLPLAGGEAWQLTTHAGGINSYRWSADASVIVFVAEEPRPDIIQAEWDKGADPVFVDEGPNGKSSGLWSNLWAVDPVTKKEVRLTDEQHRVGGYDVSPDGSRVVFSARRDARRNYPFLSELYMVGTNGDALARLTDNNAPEGGVLWAPDGKTFAYIAPDDQVFELTNGYIWIMNPDTGEARKLEGQDQGEIDQLSWTPDGRSLLFSEVHRTNTNLFRMDVDTGALTQITHVTGTLRPLGFSEDRTRMVYSFTDFDTPPDLYSADISGHDEVRLTDSNPWIEKELALAGAEIVRWHSHDGMQIEGVLYRPVGYQKSTRVPLMLHVHGGPSGYFGNTFDFEFQLYAGLGYASLGPNVRGSSAYGDELLRGLIGDVGGGEYEDLMSGVDHVSEMGIADPEQLGVRGWSWGGVLSSWVVTQTTRFKAASIGAMVGSWVAETGPGFNFDVTLWYIGGSHWEDLEEWMQHSSLTHVGNVTTPSLILHGGEDTTSSVGQSLMFFTALRDRGVPTRFIKFPRQQHGVREPRLLRVLHVEETRWMEKYIRGMEWEPWVREKK